MYDAVGEPRALDEVSPEAWMYSEIDERAARCQNPADLMEDRAHVVYVGVEECTGDGRKSGIWKREVTYVSTDDVSHPFASNAELVG